MPTCDGKHCDARIPWRIDGNQLQLEESGIALDVDDIRWVLDGVVHQHLAGADLPPIVDRRPGWRSLCRACWRTLRPDPGDVEAHLPANVLTTTQVCCFMAEDPAFLADGHADAERIVSCILRQLMHCWSKDARGLAAYDGVLSVHWNAVVADLLAHLTFRRLFARHEALRHYHTPYHAFVDSIERAAWDVQSMPAFKWRRWMAGGTECNALPVELRDFIHIHNQPHMRRGNLDMRLAVSVKVQELLFEGLVTWFFAGPETVVASIGQDCRGFLTIDGVGELVNVGQVFPDFRGRAARAIPI